MFTLLPLVVLGLIFNYLSEKSNQIEGDLADWRGRLLTAVCIWGSFLVISTEALSLLRAVTRMNLILLWAMAALIVFTVSVWQKRSLIIWTAPQFPALEGRKVLNTILSAGLVLLSGVLFLVSVKSPSNTNESMQYHMPRVMHWAQNQSLSFYPVAYEPQLFHPVWSEMAILHLRILASSDWPVNLVQWGSMVISILGIMQIVKLLGGSRRAEYIAALFTFSIPMGILQTTSTQTDYVTTMWFIITIYLAVQGIRSDKSYGYFLLLGAAIGSGCLAKATYYFFALPVLIWFVIMLWKKRGFSYLFKNGLLITAVVFALNAGYWIRNMNVYSFPLGPITFVDNHAVLGKSVGEALVNSVEYITYNFAFRQGVYSQTVETVINRLRDLAGASGDPFKLIFAWNHEDIAGNPFHFLLVFLSIPFLLISRKTKSSEPFFQLGLALIGSFLLFGSVIKSGPYNGRYLLVFLAGWSIPFGLAADRVLTRKFSALLTVFFLVVSLPYVFLNKSRPVIGAYPTTASGSIFREEPRIILFSNRTYIRDAYFGAARVVEESACKDVGMVIDSHDPEYALWYLLEAPQSGIRLEHVIYPEYLARFADPSFNPCMILCTICSGQTEFDGFIKHKEFDDFHIYINPLFVPEAGT